MVERDGVPAAAAITIGAGGLRPLPRSLVKIEPVLPLSGTVTVNGGAPGQNSLRISMQVDDSGAKLPAYGVQIRSRMVPVDPSGAYTLPGVFVGTLAGLYRRPHT